ncbi:SufE family protein [Tomitella cavernea]|uniref:SufE family protein n=1 Tax=Tomitella cavernea TaxID=1387982 RepID=A0ABP9CCK3_9ACTN|nr:SufE family protein [Tomitella cavernea]
MSIPAALAEIIDDFEDLQGQDKVTLLLEFSQELPPLPAELEEAAMEPVPECQSPLFLRVDAADRQSVRLYFSAPPEAPTTRGFAGILHEGLNGSSAEDILAVPDDFYSTLGLEKVVSPLRLRGLSAMLSRVKRNIRESA